VKLIPFVVLFLLLLSSCIVHASSAGNSTSLSNNSSVSIKSPTVDLLNINYTQKDSNTSVKTDTSTQKMEPGVLMIKKGLEGTVVDNVNKLFVGFGGMQLGALNGTKEMDESQVAIFAVAAHTLDPTRDPATMSRIATMRDIYIYAILIFGAFLALFLIYQIISPDESAKLLEDFTGNYTYIAPTDMIKYFANTCGWLLFGPSILYASLQINNFLVEGQMLSVLDQVAFTSDNIGLYIIMVLLWLASICFFAIRIVLIIIAANIWILYGIGFAFRKIRWAAVLATTYQIVFIFSQFVIIWICCVMVSYTASQELAWYSVSFIYLGLFLTVVFMEIIFVLWPIIWKLLSPQTLTTAIRLARYV